MEIWLDEPSFPKNIILVMKLYSQSSNIIGQNLGFVTASIISLSWTFRLEIVVNYFQLWQWLCLHIFLFSSFLFFFDLNNLVSFLYKLYVFFILLTILHLSCGLLTFQSFSILLIIVNHRICSNVLSSSTQLLWCMALILPQIILSNL